METLRRLAWLTVVISLGTVILGSWTRINGAGMTCPDWPLCRGEVVPSLADGTIWEWTHRLFAFSLGPLVLALLAAAWFQRRRSRLIPPTAIAVAGLLGVQIFLGAATVHLNNSPLSVVLHWGTAMAFIASLVALAIFARDERQAISPSALTLGLAMTAIAAFATMCVGAYVSSSGAGLACLSVPECAGHVVTYSPGQVIQMLHRGLAAITLLAIAIMFGWSFLTQTSRRVRSATTIAVVLIMVQILLGLLNVVWRLPTDLREAHALNAALLFLSLIVATVFSAIERDRTQLATVRT